MKRQSILVGLMVLFTASSLVCRTAYCEYLYGGVAGSNGIWKFDPADWSYERFLTAELSAVTAMTYVPEPVTILLLSLGSFGLLRRRRA